MAGFDLDRFVAAQAPVYGQVTAELRAGRKQTHWMWFIFPQIAGLGQSATARHFALVSGAEAEAYQAHPLLGQRLLECTGLVNAAAPAAALAIFGTPDDMKFHSCVTLFHRVTGLVPYGRALELFHGGREDVRTVELLG